MTHASASSDVLVVGAGPAGLALGHRLLRLGADVRVVDRAPQAGGHTRTLVRDAWRHELGPYSFLGSAEHVFDLADELGLSPVKAQAANRRYLFVDGALRALPSGPFSAITTTAIPFGAKMRLLREPFIREPEGDSRETVRAFFERRFGAAATDRLVDAFVSGVYAGDISALGMAATFPKMYSAAKEHGSLIRGAFARRPQGAKPARRGTYSFETGMGEVTGALASSLGRRLVTRVDGRLQREGSGWRLGDFRADHVAIAAPAHAAAGILEESSPELSGALRQIDYVPVAVVHLLLRSADLPRPLDGFGFLIPRRERVRLLGCIWASALFDVCDDDHAALACFIGGAHDRSIQELGDEALLAQVLGDLKTTMGLAASPVDVAVVRHPRAIPQYGPNHLDWRRRVRELASKQAGLHLVGNHLEGVSLNDTFGLSERTAREIHKTLTGATRAA